jgi:hypothetical protein
VLGQGTGVRERAYLYTRMRTHTHTMFPVYKVFPHERLDFLSLPIDSPCVVSFLTSEVYFSEVLHLRHVKGFTTIIHFLMVDSLLPNTDKLITCSWHIYFCLRGSKV